MRESTPEATCTTEVGIKIAAVIDTGTGPHTDTEAGLLTKQEDTSLYGGEVQPRRGVQREGGWKIPEVTGKENLCRFLKLVASCERLCGL